MVPASQSLLVSQVPRAGVVAAAAYVGVGGAATRRARGRTQRSRRRPLIAIKRSRAGRRSRSAFFCCGLPCLLLGCLRAQPFATAELSKLVQNECLAAMCLPRLLREPATTMSMQKFAKTRPARTRYIARLASPERVLVKNYRAPDSLVHLRTGASPGGPPVWVAFPHRPLTEWRSRSA